MVARPEMDARSASPDIFLTWSIPGLLADIKVRRCRPTLWAFAVHACSGGTLGSHKACGLSCAMLGPLQVPQVVSSVPKGSGWKVPRLPARMQMKTRTSPWCSCKRYSVGLRSMV